jgi:hypothetical protein
VDAVLSAQGVNLGREYWVMRTYGGAICTTALGDVAALANRVAGDYALEDGSKVHIKAEAYPGLLSDLIAAQENTEIVNIVSWKGHPYLVTGYTGARVYVNGALAGYKMQTLTMTDPYEDRSVRFDRAKDSLQEFQGTVRFVVTRR